MTENSSQSTYALRFGKLNWTLPPHDNLTILPASPAAPIENLGLAIDASLSQPVSFPSLDQAVVPGDQLVFVVDSSVPQLVDIVGETLQWFVSRGVIASNMHVVIADAEDAICEELRARLQKLEMAVNVERHDGSNPENLAYLAANEASDPIYMNRRLVDADVVIPITCGRCTGALDYLGPYGVFPLVSDSATRGKFYTLDKLRQPAFRQDLRTWADQAAWWLGLLVAIQVVPASGDGVAEIRCGTYDDLETQSQAAMQAAWDCAPPPQEMAIVLVDGPAHQQTWLNLARAIYSAQNCVQHGGSIVVCTSLSGAIGAGLKRLRQPDKSADVIMQQLSSDAHADSIAAAVILNATADHHVYLASELRKSSVESLGLGVIEDQEQLAHLVNQVASCAVIHSAQYAVCSV